MADPRFGVVFKQFYDGEPDEVRGLVAYGLYKIAKREWTETFYENKGVAPERSDVVAYTSTWTPAMIAGKQTQADAILDDYGRSLVDAARPTIVETALRGSLGRTIGINIFSAFLYTLILIGLVVVLRYSGVDLLALAGTVR
ncbi:hypothetical protein KZX46_11755 [Polymorphobacter sp. PAMC 29334]|uniref:hypothetical protein n=1 Tax=Polymorphobacter sp. PAMC 29334 TaxID=2862331 RepID=UPI001C77A7D8|nr:hypothetical protein [Polymorphobacter sp. PAMC 29334]QYE36529.1 hypothetical protein KZX46_11755 [Polymorphobacter sp. PAMC 29334]